MPGCAALNCNNSTVKGFRVHDFPVNIDRRRLWADRSGRDFSAYENGLPTKNMKLCEAHFTADQYVPDARYGRKLKPNAVPTLFDGLMHREVQDNLEQHLHQDIEFDQECIDRAASENPEENFQPECHVPEHALLADSLAEANRQLRRKDERIAELLREKHDLQQQVRTSRGREAVFDENLGSFLNKDQIQRLRIAGKGTGFPWTEATIKDAIQIRIMTGVKGYEYLRTCKGFPLPSYRTICRRLESCQFEAGLDNEIFSLLGSKLRGEEEINRHCWLSMDEMTIKNALEFDKGLKKYVGFISPDIAANEEEKGIAACKVFAFIVRGLSVKWKQTIAYFLVGASVDTVKLWECILCIIRKLHAEGLNVRGITMDMGPNNTALWSHLGIHAVRGSTQNTVDHPIIADQKLYISPDLAHLLKNLWTALTVQDIYLPPELSEEHPEWDGHSTVSIKHISKLIELQERPHDRGITLQHKLRRYHIRPIQRQKMRVKYAAQALSRSTAVALRFCADSELIPEIDSSALPTAWFIEQVNEWFDYMNDRKHGINGQYVGDRKIAIIEDFSRLIASLSFEREGWKPVQRGIILATKNVVDLHSDLVTNGAFRYLLPGRLTSDCIENLFSQVRQSGSENPGPAEVRLGLRLITVSQFLYVPKGSNYEEDDDDYIVEFLRARGRAQPNPDPVEDEDFVIPEDLTELQCQGLYKLAGWVAKKVSTRACFYCREIAISGEPLDNCPSEWTTMLSRGGLTHPSLPLYRIVKTAEEVFNSLKETLLHANAPLSILKEQILLNIDPEILDEIQPQCEHDLLSVIINKFISFRVHVLADDRTRRIPNDIAYGGRVWHMANGARVRRCPIFEQVLNIVIRKAAPLEKGEEVWNFYSMLNKMNSFGFRNPTIVRQLFGDNHESNEEIARRMLRIHEETNTTEISVNKKIFRPFFGIVTSNSMLLKCLDEMEIFVNSINDDYEKFYEIVIKHGYILNNQLGDLPESVFQDIDSKIRMIRKIMTAADALVPGYKNLITAITNYIAIQRETLCGDIQPITEVLVQLFRIAIIAEIKFSVMLSFVNIYRFPEDQEWKVANNFAKMQFRTYFASYVTILKDNLGTVENLYVRACDPDRGSWILDENAYELNGFTQSAIFKYDWTKCGFESCDDMWQLKRIQCDARFHDERSGCANILNKCTKLYGVTACVLKNGPHKFQYVNSTELGLLGNDSKCPEDDAYIIDDRFSVHRTCGCNCDHYHHNISVSLLESKGGNMVITGLRFCRKNNILHIQPRMGKLGKNGYILPNSERWLHIPNDKEVVQPWTINTQDSVLFLNDLRLPPGFVLTGVKFTQVNRQFLDGFMIEIIGVPFDYKSGRLDYRGRVRVFPSINTVGLPIVFKPINSLGINLRNKPSSGDQMFVQFKRSFLENDFGQSTLPLFDAVPIRTNPPSALGGIGMFHKGVDSFAGFISLRAYGIRYTGYFENFTSAHTIDDEFQLFT